MSPDSPTIDRRSVLKWTSGAAAALTVGVGTGAARQGGSGVVLDETWQNYRDEQFRIVREGDTYDFACRGNNEDKTWQCYGILFESQEWGDSDYNLYVNPNRRLDIVEDEDSDEWHEFTGNGLECKHHPRVKVSFKPVDEGNDGGGRGRGNGRGR